MNYELKVCKSKHTLLFCYSAFTGTFIIYLSYSDFVLLLLVVFLFLNIMYVIQIYVFYIMEKSVPDFQLLISKTLSLSRQSLE